MKSSLKLAIDVSPESLPMYRALACRSRTVQLADDADNCTALVTDNTETAITAKHDRHVLVVNPFELAAETCQGLTDAARSFPAHPARFRPSVAQVKTALDAGKLGDAGLLRIHCWNPEAESAESLAREIDLALWMFGGLPSEIYGLERSGYIQAHLGFACGGMAIIDLDTVIHAGSEYYSLSMVGSTGAAYADDHPNFNLLMAKQGTKVLLTQQDDTALAAMIDRFATIVREGGEFAPNWSDTESALRVADHVRKSARDQNVVTAEGSHV